MKMNYVRPLTSFLVKKALSENWIVFAQSGFSTLQGSFTSCPAGLGRNIYSIAVSESDTTLNFIITPQSSYNINVYLVNENSSCMQFQETSDNPGEAVNSGDLNLQDGTYSLYITGIPSENFSVALQYNNLVDIHLSESDCFFGLGFPAPDLESCTT